jgi:hypothetical protein
MQHEEDEPMDADTWSAAPSTKKRSRAKGWILAGIVIAAVAIGWEPTPSPRPAPLHCHRRHR